MSNMKVSRTSPIWRRVCQGILILGISGCALAVAELGLRLAFPEKVGLNRAEFYAAYQSHPKYLLSLKPSVEQTFIRSEVNGGDVIQSRINRHGFRGKELRNNADTRIIVYGDSNIQAPFSRLENTFPAKLEAYLSNLSNRDIEVINAGVIGFGPDQSLIRFSEEADVFKPRIAVLQIFAGNDFGDLIRNRLFKVSGGKLLGPIVNEDVVAAQLHARKNLSNWADSLLITHAARKLLNLVTFQDLSEAYVSRLMADANREYSVYRRGGDPESGDHYDIDIAVDPQSESAMTKIALMDAILAEVQRVASSRGIELVVLIEPSAVDLTTNIPLLNYKSLSKYSAYRRERLTSLVEDICIRRQVPSLNLSQVFLENHPDTLFFLNDDHWNDAGQDLAARETAKYINSFFLKP